MRTISKQYPVLLAAAVLAAALSGCGGGSSTKMDSGTGTGGADNGTGGADNGMTGDGLTVPEGLVRYTVPPIFTAVDDIDDFTLPTLASGIRRDFDEQRSRLANDAYIKSLRYIGVGDDEDDIPLSLYATYVVGDEEVTVHFTEADSDGEFSWSKTIAGVDYWGWAFELSDSDGMTSLIGGRAGDRLYATGGVRTEIADLPSGAAVYEGRMRGDSHLANDPSSTGRQRMQGSLSLTADFDQGSLEGRISSIEVRGHDERQWASLPTTTHFAIEDGRIVDGQFTASLTGMDSNANAPMDETVRGYEGGVLGEFYRRDAGSVGGVLNASREDRVMAGVFGGHKQ